MRNADWSTGIFAVAVALVFATPSSAQEGCSDWFKSGAARWEEPQDTRMALLEPDCYAWRLFFALNWPADVGAKAPDSSKAFGVVDGPVVWETWRNAKNQASDTAFPLDGSDPGEWLSAPTIAMRTVDDIDAQPLQQVEALKVMFGEDTPIPGFDEDATDGNNETRLNRETYEFVRANSLYNLDGQQALFDSGQASISFPAMAKEIKAQWREISEADKPRYHWTEITTPSGNTVFGLTALHITTKDLPNWLWATFEHIDNKPSEADGGRPGNIGWKLPSVDRFACAAPPHDCDLAPAGIGLQGTKWENYRLRGTQVDFVDTRGNVTLLANSQPESTFQETSSCITCHALSTIGANAERIQFFKFGPAGLAGYVGAPDPELFRDASTGKSAYTQLDFVWSLFRVQPKSQ